MDEETVAEHAALVARVGGTRELIRAVLERRAGRNTLPLITDLRVLTSAVKAKTTIEYALDVLESGLSIVIFTWRRQTVKEFARALSKADRPVFTATGADSQDRRDLSVDEFQARGGAFIATLDSLKEGVTLHTANHIVIHDISWVPVDVLQAERRVFRIGQTRPTMIKWALAKDSIDVLLARVIREKAKVMSDVLQIEAANDALAELELPAFLGEERDRGFADLFAALGIQTGVTE